MKTRFVFKNDVHEVNAVIEGPEAWVNYIADQLGLGGECGWTTKISGPTEGPRADPDNFRKELPGPPPDPTKIPAVIREIGSFNPYDNDESFDPPKLDENELKMFINEMPEPEIPPESISTDPLTEEWLRLVLAIAVTEHGLSSLSPDVIHKLISDRTNQDEISVSLALKRLWNSGKVDRILTDSGYEYAPSPSWIQIYRE
tara:strand:- start:13228 stop:13830 length:603 start_codon:yes stop_codon:yes gene_type:complete